MEISSLYATNDFRGGMSTQFVRSKNPQGTYRLGFDVRVRKNAIGPTRRHVKLKLPGDQRAHALYATSSTLYVAIDGMLYHKDMSASGSFALVSGWTRMETSGRFYFESVPATFNLFNRTAATVENTARVFNSSISPFPQIFIVQDGVNTPQFVYGDNTAELSASYASWTQNSPTYVPIGKQMAFSGEILFILSSDGDKVYRSVSGRPTDFVVNIQSNGNAGGDETTTAIAYSGATGTAILPAQGGGIIGFTLGGSFSVQPNYDILIFGEPYFFPSSLFPVGAVNDLSFAQVNGNLAFIAQSGIYSFNEVLQTQQQSNFSVFSAPIYDILAKTQTGGCATNFDSYALFAVNTIYGPAVVVYDQTIERFVSIDVSFGEVSQFATLRSNGIQRLFFLTADGEVYEAFASDEYNVGRVYIGDFCSQDAEVGSEIDAVSLIFQNVTAAGQVRVSLWCDGKLSSENTLEVPITEPAANNTFVPEESRVSTAGVDINFVKNTCWQVGALIEWNFAGELTNFSVAGGIIQENSTLQEASGPTVMYATGSNYVDDALTLTGAEPLVVKGETYVFDPRASGAIVAIGNKKYDKRAYVYPQTDKIAISESSGYVLTPLVYKAPTDYPLIHLGNMTKGTDAENVRMNMWINGNPVIAVPGPNENDAGNKFFAVSGMPRGNTITDLAHVDIFVYDPGLSNAAAVLDGLDVTGPSNNPEGWLAGSVQDGRRQGFLSRSEKPFQVILCALPPYPNYRQLQHIGVGADMVVSTVGDYYHETIGGTFYLTLPAGIHAKFEFSQFDIRIYVSNGDSFTVPRRR